MDKKELLEVINSNIHYINTVMVNMYHNKTYVVATDSQIKGAYKTKRGAEGYIKRNQGFSYYDDYFQELVYPATGEIFEILDIEIIDILSSKMFWYKQLKSNMCNVKNGYDNILWEAKKANTNDEILQYIKESIDDIQNDRGLIVYEEVQEVLEIEIKEVQEEKKEIVNNKLNIEIKFNEEKNGIELYFNDKPNEDIRSQLKANKFRWAKFNKCWYVKDTEESRSFLKELGLLNSEGNQENNSIDTTELKEIEYPIINIDDIESYTVSKELSDRENNISMFRKDNKDHNKEIQNRMIEVNELVLKALEGNKIPYVEFKAKTFLQSWKKKSYDLYLRMLNHKASNPSWAVTGRGNMNVGRYNKKLSQYDNMLKQWTELDSLFDSEINKIENKVYRQKENEQKDKINSIVNSEISIPKFEKKVIKYIPGAVDNIFNEGTTEIKVNYYQGYSIFKNWGRWRCYNIEGQEVFSVKITGSLEEAKKILIYKLQEQKAI